MTLYLGIDVGQDHLDLALLDLNERTHTKSVRNNDSGHKAMLRWLGRFTSDLSQVHACMEASGGFQDEGAQALHTAGLIVSIINPRRAAAYAAVQLRRSKPLTPPYWPDSASASSLSRGHRPWRKYVNCDGSHGHSMR